MSREETDLKTREKTYQRAKEHLLKKHSGQFKYFNALIDFCEAEVIEKVTKNPVLRDQYHIGDVVNESMLYRQGYHFDKRVSRDIVMFEITHSNFLEIIVLKGAGSWKEIIDIGRNDEDGNYIR